jgi:hypothetical protein
MAKDLTAALHALTEQAQGQTSRVDKALPEAMAASAIPARSGAAGPKSAAGSGIASPLVETDYAERTFHPERNLRTTDGLFVLKIKPVKAVRFKDANQAPLTIEFKAPA